METIKFTHNGRDYLYEIISHMVWKEKNILTIMMQECGDNLFKWIKNNSTTGARHYKADIVLNDENDNSQCFMECSIMDFSYSSVIGAYTVVVSYGDSGGQ